MKMSIPVGTEACRLRLSGRGRAAIVHGVLACLYAVLRSEGGRLLGAVLAHDRHGQRLQERRRDDRQADLDLQQDPPGGHHQGAHRDHLGSGGFGLVAIWTQRIHHHHLICHGIIISLDPIYH